MTNKPIVLLVDMIGFLFTGGIIVNYEIIKSNDIYCVNCNLKINAGIIAVSF